MANSSLVNPVRTGVQAVPAMVITEAVDAFLYDMSDRQYLALAALLLLVFSWIQALVELKMGRAFLKESPAH